MTPHRLSVKFFTEPGSKHELSRFIALFHKFIQGKSLEGLLVDVADYAHVPDGPGILLIGHEVDYGMDLTGGAPGLLVRRKRCTGDLASNLRDTLRKAIAAVKAIERDGSTGAAYSTQAFTISLIDKLNTPNTSHAYETCRSVISEVVGELGGSQVTVERGDSDPRQNLSFVVRVARPLAA